MSAVTVNISFESKLLNEIDRVAKEEARSRSDFVREAARAYIERRERWAGLLALGRDRAKTRGLTPEDVAGEIRAWRREKARSS